jgi:nucleolar protein 9
MFEEYFQDKLIEFSEHHVANFVVQHLISNCKDEDLFNKILEELSSSFEYLLFQNRAGVIAKLVQVCLLFNKSQKKVMESLKAAFRIDSPEKRKKFLKMILYMRPSEQVEGQVDYLRVQVQGALMLQYLFSYEEAENQILCEGIHSLDTETLMKWIHDPSCSRVIEAYFDSVTVSSKSKKKMLHTLQGKYSDMAKDKYASHLIDKCWKASDIQLKEKIAEELVQQERELMDNFYGKFILRNCKIELFKRRKQEWMQLEKGIDKKKEMLKELF